MGVVAKDSKIPKLRDWCAKDHESLDELERGRLVHGAYGEVVDELKSWVTSLGVLKRVLHVDIPQWLLGERRKPMVTHICFLCGTTGATKERVKQPEVQEQLRQIWDRRVPAHSWIRATGYDRFKFASEISRDAAKSNPPEDILSMQGHLGQAFDMELEPIGACQICSVVRGYGELIENSTHPVISGEHECAEFVNMQRCRAAETAVIGPTDPAGLQTAESRDRFLKQFYRSIEVSWIYGQGGEDGYTPHEYQIPASAKVKWEWKKA